MEVCSCFRRERQRQSKSAVFLKFVRILKFVKIREFQEFLKFIKYEFSIYAQNQKPGHILSAARSPSSKFVSHDCYLTLMNRNCSHMATR